MRILGLDPGTATTGYGIVDAEDGEFTAVVYGVIKTPAKMPMPQRLQIIQQELQQLLDEFRPDTVGIEEVFFGRNVTTAITVGQARGVLLLTVANAGLPIGEYSPPKIKPRCSSWCATCSTWRKRPAPTTPPTAWLSPLPITITNALHRYTTDSDSN